MGCYSLSQQSLGKRYGHNIDSSPVPLRTRIPFILVISGQLIAHVFGWWEETGIPKENDGVMSWKQTPNLLAVRQPCLPLQYHATHSHTYLQLLFGPQNDTWSTVSNYGACVNIYEKMPMIWLFVSLLIFYAYFPLLSKA